MYIFFKLLQDVDEKKIPNLGILSSFLALSVVFGLVQRVLRGFLWGLRVDLVSLIDGSGAGFAFFDGFLYVSTILLTIDCLF